MRTQNYLAFQRMTKIFGLAVISVIFFYGIVFQGEAYTYNWEIDETPQGSESVTPVEPVEVNIFGEQVQLPSLTAVHFLVRKYIVFPDLSWDRPHVDKLLKTFESIPQDYYALYQQPALDNVSIWRLSDEHIQDDILIENIDGIRIVTVSKHAFGYANPLMAEIEGVRGRYYSKRLHNAVVRFITDNGNDRGAIRRILKERYSVSLDVPDYAELTRNTTQEHSGRFSEFKNKEVLAIISMLEEFPMGMLKTPGLKYIVRRLDGTPHPIYKEAPAVAWPTEGYIEFMESAFQGQSLEYIHRLILHEKAHFMWEHLFDNQLKQDWIEVGGWYENPDDKDGWSTTKQLEFVSAYAHGINPNEDMAESISYYIVTPDRFRSRSPEKYEFIQSRIMHGTRYISKIREDLTFEVYNLYPDYVYPGKIVRLNVEVMGELEEDKTFVIEIEIHSESDLDTAYGGITRIISEKDTYVDVYFYPVDTNGNRVTSSHILRSDEERLSKYAANGHWIPDQISVWDANQNERHNGISDFGWGLYIDNPLADCEPPEYVPNSLKLSLRKSTDEESESRGGEYQLLIVEWLAREKNDMNYVWASMNDDDPETYSRGLFEYGYKDQINRRDDGLIEVQAELPIPDYQQDGTYEVNYIGMEDVAGNGGDVYFTDPGYRLGENAIIFDEIPPTIEIHTPTPDTTPPVLDLNNITIRAEPTHPEAPNGETNVYVTFKIKDDISGYAGSELYLRDPLGVIHSKWHSISDRDNYRLYFDGDPTVYRTYDKTILLPVSSVPGTWGLAEMKITDKAGNALHADFTEIVRFEVDDGSYIAKSDINKDGVVNIIDLVLVANILSNVDTLPDGIDADINDDGVVNILDLVEVASNIGENVPASPDANLIAVEHIERWIAEARKLDDGSYAFKRGIRVLEKLLLTMRPETTVLLPNYPNPFNPETWIPYQLANAGQVQITIYDTKGAIVRTLDLGHQAAGYYTHRNRAAYWDGRNGLGENVASGVYFYQLQAGSVSNLRKMVILK